MEHLENVAFKRQATVPSIWIKGEAALSLSKLAAAMKAWLSSTDSAYQEALQLVMARELTVIVFVACQKEFVSFNLSLLAESLPVTRDSLPAKHNDGVLHWLWKTIVGD